MRLNESDSTKHGSKPAAKRTRRVSTAATPRVRAQRTSRESRPTPVVRPGDDQVRLRAYEFYLQRDSRPGDPLEDWLRAERELIDEAR